MLSKTRPPLTRKEKSFFVATAIICGGIVVFGVLSLPPEVDIPAMKPLPAKNAYPYYKAVETAMAKAKAPVDYSMDDYASYRTIEEKAWLYSLPRRKAWLKTHAKAGNLIQAGLKLPYRVPAKNWENYRSFNTYNANTFFYWYKAVEAKTHFQEGHTSEALDSALDLVEIAGQTTHSTIFDGRYSERYLISRAKQIALEPLEQASLIDLKNGLRRLEDLKDEREPYSQVLQDWRSRDLTQLLSYMDGTSRFLKNEPYWVRQTLWRRYYCGLQSTPPTQEASLLKLSKRGLIQEIEATFKAAQSKSTKLWDKDSKLTDEWYLRDLEDALQSLRTLEMNCLAQRRALMLIFALQIFKVQHGSFPQQLSELSPDILKSLPIDPYSPTESSFGYRRKNADYVLYSVGPNGQDNKGESTSDYPNLYTTQPPETKDWDDLVFAHKPKTQELIPPETRHVKPKGTTPLFVPPFNPLSPPFP